MSRRLNLAFGALVLFSAVAAAAEPPPATDEAIPASAFGPASDQPESGPAPVTTAAPASSKKEARTGGLIPHVLIGPKITATVLFPPNVMVGGELKIAGYVGASFESAVFPTERSAGSSSGYGGKIKAWSAGLRVFPFRGSFFLGAAAGEYDVTLMKTQDTGSGGVPTVDTLRVKGTYVGPQIGWKWTSSIGMFAGLNLGYGFSLSYSSQLVSTNAPYAGAQSDLDQLKQNVDKNLKSGVPIFTLLELGWVF